MKNVIMFSATPREIKENYRQKTIVLTFLPGDEPMWRWSFTVTHTSRFKGEAKTKHHALQAAKRRIDQMEDR